MIEIGKVQKYVAHSSIGPTTLRKMTGVVGQRPAMQEYLATLDLWRFSENGFATELDSTTGKLAEIFSGNWGAARKALNLFLRDVVSHVRLSKAYQLDGILPLLELPLDSRTMSWLIKEREGQVLKKVGVSKLNIGKSDQFQQAASKVATRLQINRVDIDFLAWPS